jgi:hypothetical protein
MSNFHFDLIWSKGGAYDVSGEVQKFSGEVQNDLSGVAHLPSKSGYGKRIYNAQNYANVKIWKAQNW